MEPTKPNPANEPPKAMEVRERIPMSLPHQKLAVPDIPGYHLHWMRGDAQRIQQALQGGYEFVEQDEVQTNTFGVADGLDSAPGTDLGSRVSVVGGQDGQRQYLMKIKQELWDQDEATRANSQERIAAQIRGDKGFQGPSMDASNRYGRKENRNIFQPNRRT